jgi:hypothetical protein
VPSDRWCIEDSRRSIMDGRVVFSDVATLPEDDNVMPKHVGATIHKLNE